VIELTNVSKTYMKRSAIKNISLTLPLGKHRHCRRERQWKVNAMKLIAGLSIRQWIGNR
jgi:hypothetical protein